MMEKLRSDLKRDKFRPQRWLPDLGRFLNRNSIAAALVIICLGLTVALLETSSSNRIHFEHELKHQSVQTDVSSAKAQLDQCHQRQTGAKIANDRADAIGEFVKTAAKAREKTGLQEKNPAVAKTDKATAKHYLNDILPKVSKHTHVNCSELQHRYNELTKLAN